MKEFRTTIKKHRLIKKGDKILVGVSGGPDSLALLLLLDGLKKELDLKLHVAHFDHNLRKDSLADAEFVRKAADKLKMPFTMARADKKALAKKGSPEELARNARFAFLFRVARSIRADKIALGHNLDDQAETVLMRILRGTGLCGLAGILPERNFSGFTVIRPLIGISRKDIEAYLARHKIKPRRDISNTQDIYFRNKIRNKLLPYLEKEYNKNIREVLVNMAQLSAGDYDYLQRAALKILKNNKFGIALPSLNKAHPAMRRLIFRGAYAKLKGDTRRLVFQHIKEIEDLVLSRPVNSIVDLPQGISVIKKKKTLFFYRR